MRMDDVLHVAVVTPVVHYCMGGLRVNPAAEVLNPVRYLTYGYAMFGEH